MLHHEFDKLGYPPKELNAKRNFPRTLEIARLWAPVLQYELDHVEPTLIVLMGKKILVPLFNALVSEGELAIPTNVRVSVVKHYGYFHRGGSDKEGYFNEFQSLRKTESEDSIQAILES